MASHVQIVQFCAHAGALACAFVASSKVGQAHHAAGGRRVGGARACSGAAVYSMLWSPPSRLTERSRSEFAAAEPGSLPFFLLGLFISLAPGFVRGVLQERGHTVQGAVVFLVLAIGTLT